MNEDKQASIKASSKIWVPNHLIQLASKLHHMIFGRPSKLHWKLILLRGLTVIVKKQGV